MPVGDSAYTTASVTGLFRHRVPQVLSLRWASGDTLGVTPAHPFFSKDRGRWVPAGELAVGERVLAKAGTQVLEGTKIWPGERTVYNLEVGGAHNFLVGCGGLVVHNGCAKYTKGQLQKNTSTYSRFFPICPKIGALSMKSCFGRQLINLWTLQKFSQ